MVQNVQMLGKYNNRGLQSSTRTVRTYKINKIRTYRRLLFIGLFVFALLSVSGLASAFLANEDAYAASTHVAKQMTVFVEQGDTLWSIAQDHAAKGEDIREYVYSLKKLNGLKNSTLQAGQKLILPANR